MEQECIYSSESFAADIREESATSPTYLNVNWFVFRDRTGAAPTPFTEKVSPPSWILDGGALMSDDRVKSSGEELGPYEEVLCLNCIII